MTYRIWQLTDSQQKALFDFLLSTDKPDGSNSSSSDVASDVPSTPSKRHPLPILPSGDNLVRFDPEDPIEETGIYRDTWDRKPLDDDDIDPRLRRCTGDRVEFPTRADEEKSRERAGRRAEIVGERNHRRWAPLRAARRMEVEEQEKRAAEHQRQGQGEAKAETTEEIETPERDNFVGNEGEESQD